MPLAGDTGSVRPKGFKSFGSDLPLKNWSTLKVSVGCGHGGRVNGTENIHGGTDYL